MKSILTERLNLRPLSLQDADDLIEVRFNEEVTKYIKRDKPNDKTEIVSFIKDRIVDVENGKILFWAISLIKTPKLIGTICLWNFNDNKAIAEVGYELHPDYHGQGFMSEALNAVLNYGFKELSLISIEAFTNKHNESSKMLLKKFKFILDAQRKDEGFPNNIIYTKQNA